MFRMLKLRPPNGWQAVVWELAIVTLGVLIALDAQQWVDDLSWQAKVREARVSLKRELEDHYLSSVEWRMAEPCIAAQLDRLEKRLLAAGQRLDPAPRFSDASNGNFVLRIPIRPYNEEVWRGTISDGVSSHFPPDEREQLGNEYRQARGIDELNRQAKILANRLFTLSKPMEISAEIRFSASQIIDEMRGTNRWMSLTAGQLIARIAMLDMIPARGSVERSIAESGTLKFCRSQRLPILSETLATSAGQ